MEEGIKSRRALDFPNPCDKEKEISQVLDFANAKSLRKRGLRKGKSLDFPNPCDKERKSHRSWILLTQADQ